MWQSTITARDLQGRIRIDCPPARIPLPGQYLLAQGEGEAARPLAVSLFPAGLPAPDGLWCAPDTPYTWQPGTRLYLRGPLGNGFTLSPHTRRLALFALDVHPWRLMPLIQKALQQAADISLLTDHLPPAFPLPAGIESLPLAFSSEILHAWADTWAADLPSSHLESLTALLHTPDDAAPASPGEILVAAPMPCGGQADCGVCTISLGSRPRLICKHGPVFRWEVPH